MNKKGFTLVELLAVIVILAILATAAFTLVIPRVNESRKKAFVSEISELLNAADVYFLNHPNDPDDIVNIRELIDEGYASVKGDVSSYDGWIKKDSSGTYMISFTNGSYKTNGALSNESINVDNISTGTTADGGNTSDAIDEYVKKQEFVNKVKGVLAGYTSQDVYSLYTGITLPNVNLGRYEQEEFNNAKSWTYNKTGNGSNYTRVLGAIFGTIDGIRYSITYFKGECYVAAKSDKYSTCDGYYMTASNNNTNYYSCCIKASQLNTNNLTDNMSSMLTDSGLKCNHAWKLTPNWGGGKAYEYVASSSAGKTSTQTGKVN